MQVDRIPIGMVSGMMKANKSVDMKTSVHAQSRLAFILSMAAVILCCFFSMQLSAKYFYAKSMKEASQAMNEKQGSLMMSLRETIEVDVMPHFEASRPLQSSRETSRQ